MSEISVLISFIIGVIQGVLEWLPVSSEGITSLYLGIFTDVSPENSVKMALFLHGGTAVSALTYYRKRVVELLRSNGEWRINPDNTELVFLVVATFSSVIVGFTVYKLLVNLVTSLAGGVFITGIGVLLVFTGLIQKEAEDKAGRHRETPTVKDAVLIGSLQGLAILPGVSRSGTTVSALLLRDYEAPISLELSFLLSIPAAFGAGVLILLETGEVPSMNPLSASAAFAVSAAVGYVTIDALMKAVKKVNFWLICVFFGGLAVFGGVVTLLL